MTYNQDDEENFLSDKKVGEVKQELDSPRRRGGAYIESKEKKSNMAENEQNFESVGGESGSFEKILGIIAIIVAIIAVFILCEVLLSSSNNSSTPSNVTQKTETSTKTSSSTSSNTVTKDSSKSNTNSSSSKNSKNTNSSAISNVNDNYDTYDIKIESVVYKKGGNFFNNNEKIKGDKAYVEYKQISGLKDTQKQDKINAMLKETSISLYDKEYLSDENTLFIDIYSKISVNFNTLSYIVYKNYEDIDGKHVGEKVVSLNIRLDTLENISFEDLFTNAENINSMYSGYSKGKVTAFYFTPEKIYAYDDKLSETIIDMSNNYNSIAIYNKYKTDTSLFTSSPISKKVFTTNQSTVSEETKDRDFQKTK